MSGYPLRPNDWGLSLVEVLVAIGILSIFVTMGLVYFDSLARSSQLTQVVSTRDRILAGVRSVTGMPAALRSSVRAAGADGLTALNPELNYCVAGTLASGCEHNRDYPFTLFSPVVSMDATGKPLGLVPITGARGSTELKYFDTFGQACAQAGPDCPLIVTTSFRAQCGPPNLPAIPPANLLTPINYFTPLKPCTVADSIHVTYWVELDPAAATANPALSAFISPISGTVTISVKAIYGNDPR